MWIGRRIDGTVYGRWSSKQPDDADHPRQEEIPSDHPDAAYVYEDTRDQRIITDEAERVSSKQDAVILALVNSTPAQCAAWVRNNFPSLTLPEQNKLGMILSIIAVAARPVIRP